MKARQTAIAPASSPSSAPPTCSSPTPRTSAPRPTSRGASAEIHMPRVNVRRLIIGSLTVLMTTGFSGCVCHGAEPTEPRFQERWVYCSQNLLVDQNVDRVIDLIERAARSGYT